MMTQVRSGGDLRLDAVERLLQQRALAGQRRNCLGRCCRLRGQNRVPPPPAMIIA